MSRKENLEKMTARFAEIKKIEYDLTQEKLKLIHENSAYFPGEQVTVITDQGGERGVIQHFRWMRDVEPEYLYAVLLVDEAACVLKSVPVFVREEQLKAGWS